MSERERDHFYLHPHSSWLQHPFLWPVTPLGKGPAVLLAQLKQKVRLLLHELCSELTYTASAHQWYNIISSIYAKSYSQSVATWLADTDIFGVCYDTTHTIYYVTLWDWGVFQPVQALPLLLYMPKLRVLTWWNSGYEAYFKSVVVLCNKWKLPPGNIFLLWQNMAFWVLYLKNYIHILEWTCTTFIIQCYINSCRKYVCAYIIYIPWSL